MPTLRSRRDFARLKTGGRTRSDRLIVIRFVPNTLGFDRYAISTSRRVGGAVTRNRIRRRIREVLRESLAAGPGWDILVIVRPASAEATFEEMRTAVRRLLAFVRTIEHLGASA